MILKLTVKNLALLFLTIFWATASTAQVWQWSVPVDHIVSDETKTFPTAFLWIPENCKQVRGVVFTQHNMVEEGMLEHPRFRKTMSELDLAEIWVTPGFAMTFDFHKSVPGDFARMMKLLAVKSGYQELEYVPVIPMGHSAYASFPWNFAAWNPARTLAVVSVHGDTPQTNLTGSSKPNPDWGSRTIDGVPSLFIMGEYEWWEDRQRPGFDFVKKHPASPITFFADAGHGHFDYSDELIDYICLFIKKSAQKRLPKKMPLSAPTQLLSIEPAKGWLIDRWRKDSLPAASAAPYASFKGDRYSASWVFDKEMAGATETFYAKARGRKQQYIGYSQNGRILNPTKSQANYDLKFLPQADGVTFTIKAFFSDSSRTKPALGHSVQAINISRICGPVSKMNDTTFRVSFGRLGFNNIKRSHSIWLIASDKGDDQYKSAVQQASVRIPIRNEHGTPQKLTFEPIPDQRSVTREVKLNALSDAGAQVYFYVKEGPAEVREGKLIMSKIPQRAKLPLKVTVVAWQYGTSTVPQLQSAEPVEQSFNIIP